MEWRIVLSLIFYVFINDRYTDALFQNVKSDFIGLATKFGYTPKEYVVTTKDGYILKLFRIMGVSKTPVLLMHGLFDSADTWVLRGNTSLAITLANEGYDVWIGNCRGNIYGLNHTYLATNSKEFWDFTFHESGYYDLPAIIDVVLLNTKAKNLNAIGHSQGNAIFYVMGATRPEYNNKVNIVIALAPVSFLFNIEPPLKYLIEIFPKIYELANFFNIWEVFGEWSPSVTFWRELCPQPIIGYSVCVQGIISPVAGYDADELEKEFVPTMVNHFPASDSAKNANHFTQLNLRRKFAQYDYGKQMNMAIYKSAEPPEYDLSLVTMKVALLNGYNDKLSTVEDVALLKRKLPNVQQQLLPRRKMNHADFIWGLHMTEYLYPYLFDVLRSA